MIPAKTTKQQRSQTSQNVSDKRPNFLHKASAELFICLSLTPAKTINQQRSQTSQSVSNKRPNFLHNFSAEFCICLSLIPAKTTKQQRSQTSQRLSDKRPNFFHKQSSVYVYHCGCQTHVLIFTFPGIHIPKKQGFVESDKKRR